jgi:hypothetical protein
MLNDALQSTARMQAYGKTLMTDEDDLVQQVQDAVSQCRSYAGFFDWPDRDIAEWGVANLFGEIAAGEPGVPFRDVQVRGRGADPPDCEAIDSKGRLLGIEVTELVDGPTIAATKHDGRTPWMDWNAQTIRSRVHELLLSKDEKTLQGGPYDEYIVLIHTDEPALSIAAIQGALVGQELPALRQIQRAYILFSYDPGAPAYPFFRIL